MDESSSDATTQMSDEDNILEYVFINPNDPQNVTACDAEDVAMNFITSLHTTDTRLYSNPSTNSNETNSVSEYEIKDIIVVPDDNNEPALYIVRMNPQGFSIISSTNREEPVLAFSEEDSFSLDNLNEGLKDWIDSRVDRIQIIRNDSAIIDTTLTALYRAKWAKLSGNEVVFKNKIYKRTPKVIIENSGQVGPLLKTEWGQCSPYNMKIDKPIVCDENEYTLYGKPFTGCVATAIAQVAKYYAYPANMFNWSKMQNKYNYYERNKQGAEDVAKLMWRIGNDINMKYSCEGSSIHISNVPNTLKYTFKYSKGGTVVWLNTLEDFHKLEKEIQKGHPVIIGGYDDYFSGHAWVCDGFKYVLTVVPENSIIWRTNGSAKIRYFHMNWGEDGVNNGWYHYLNNDKSWIGKYKYDISCILGVEVN